ncbi:hypothetical protein RCOM_1267370 [Ricinus communis]|uniref:Uncharacterized protein n=1 Tax=Ricinus communis TaxID=3988 RepID=B9SX33_RICCO|nr:hypothetical protein RCOM_1267370 [Ricinus communis]
MAEDNMDSDACVGSKRRISDIGETPVLVIEQQQEFSNSFSTVSPTEEDNDSKESSFIATLPSPKEDQQFIQDIPSPSKKVKSSLTLPEHNQELLDYCPQEKAAFCDLDSGSSVSDGNDEDYSRNVGNLDVQLQESEQNQEILGSCGQEKALLCYLDSGSFACNVNSEGSSSKVGNLDDQLQETKNFVFVGEDNHGEIEETNNGVNNEVGFSGIEESDKPGVLKECKTVENEISFVIEEKKETLLEAKKKQLLAKVEAGSVFKDKIHVENSLGFDATAGILGGLKGLNESVKKSLKVEVIDDTAVIGTVVVAKTGNDGANNAERNLKKNGKQEADGKKAKRPRRKGKDVKKGLVINGGQKKMAQAEKDMINTIQIGQYHNGDQKNGDQIRKYSREEMEALRFVNIVQQRKLWRVIYTGLEDAVIKEYDDLASSRHHQKNFHLDFDPRKRVGRKEDASGILGESSEGEDSDDDYSSIQRPAFLVEGEPDFNSGPPEDGLEYLRRVRWEADHIPKVKVAKLDKSKVNREQSIYMPQIPEIAKCPEHFLPLKQWEDAFLTDFSELRMYLSRTGDSSSEISYKLQSIDIDHEQNTSSHQLDEDIIVEKFANLRTDEVHSYRLLEDSCPDNIIDQASVAKTGDSDSSRNYPTMSAILAMDSVARVSMLRKRISLAETMNTLSKNDCVWLFALCAAVDTPLDADTCAALRSLLRKCASIRAVKSELDDEVIMLNILIAISGRYFGQSELLEKFISYIMGGGFTS